MSDLWQCDRCTFMNRFDDIRCAICDNIMPLPDYLKDPDTAPSAPTIDTLDETRKRIPNEVHEDPTLWLWIPNESLIPKNVKESPIPKDLNKTLVPKDLKQSPIPRNVKES